MNHQNQKSLNRLIPLVCCERKCINCAFYDSSADNHTSGVCFFNEHGCPKIADAKPTTADNTCDCFLHISFRSAMGIVQRFDESKGYTFEGLRELNDEQKESIKTRLSKMVAELTRVRLSHIKNEIVSELIVPADLVQGYIIELVHTGQFELYEQHGYGAIPAQMLCAVGDIPSREEREEEARMIRAKVTAKRRAGLEATRALMAESSLAPKSRRKRAKTSRHVSAKS